MKQPVAGGSPVNGNIELMKTRAATLLDFSQKLDVNLLDDVINWMYTGVGEQQKIAQDVLKDFQKHPNAWAEVGTILEFSKSQLTKYYALQILENVIKTRWKILPRNQCEGIKKFILGLIIKTSSDQDSLEQEKLYLNKLNIILVQIFKHEWPRNWPSFFSDIISACGTNESLCQNNMVILKLLSEEVFDFSGGKMTQAKAKHLKDSMCNEFSQIFQLCDYIMETSYNAFVILSMLETLLRFLNWIPLGYIFETKLIHNLIYEYFNVPLFRNIALKCLTEIASVTAENYTETILSLFAQTMGQVEKMLLPSNNIKNSRAGTDEEQKFIQNLGIFLCTVLQEHGEMLENRADLHNSFFKALHYLLLISEVEDVEVFKTCMEYWHSLANNLCAEKHYVSVWLHIENTPDLVFVQIYKPILSKLRYLIIQRMVKPEEVLHIENDQGEVVREIMMNTDSMQLYKIMQKTLKYLTFMDPADTRKVIIKALQSLATSSEWSWENFNSLCWAISSIGGTLREEDEKNFIVAVIKDLQDICELRQDKESKVIISAKILYIVSQYHRFLKAHWKYLKTVVNKLFELMHETHNEVQDMACDTFIKIAQRCRKHFIQLQIGEACPFIDEILKNIDTIICDLQPQQIHTFYEAIGYMISSYTDPSVRKDYIEKYMALPNAVWDKIIEQASDSVDVLKDPDIVCRLGNILKTNVRACKALGYSYVSQLEKIYLHMLNIYSVMSTNISEAFVLHDDNVTKQPVIKAMKSVRKETLNLISEYVHCSTNTKKVLEDYIPPLLKAVLVDYHDCPVPDAREPKVLFTLTVIVHKLQENMIPEISNIFDHVFECTLDMINKNFEEFPEHRRGFFILLQVVVAHCFPALLKINAGQFKLILDSIIWAFKHTLRNIADIGLLILRLLLQNIIKNKDIAQSFYQTYYTEILQHLLSVVTDTSHTAGLTAQATILAYMFSIVERGEIKVPLNPVEQADGRSNVVYIQQFVTHMLETEFKHLSDAQIRITVSGFFSLHQNIPAFKEHLKDFLVEIQEFAGEDDSDLFLEEREAALLCAE